MSKKRMRAWLINGCFAACLIAGFGYGVAGAAVLATFAIWFLALGGLAIAFTQRTIPIPEGYNRTLDVTFDALVVCLLVWTGHWFLGIVYMLHIFFVQNALEREPENTAV